MYSKTRPSHSPSPIRAKAPPTFSSEMDESQMEPGPHPLSLLHWLFLFTLCSTFWSLFLFHFYFQRPYLFSSSPRPPTTEDSHIYISRSHLTSYSSTYLTSQRHSHFTLKFALIIFLSNLLSSPAFCISASGPSNGPVRMKPEIDLWHLICLIFMQSIAKCYWFLLQNIAQVSPPFIISPWRDESWRDESP